VDLRLKLHCAEAEYTDFTVVIILNVGGTVLGAVVDAVADVVALPADAIKPAPQFQGQMDASFVRGIATVGERMLIVVDIESLLSSAEMGLVKTVATA
jgi:purine-binding chemotaxis protein CheW